MKLVALIIFSVGLVFAGGFAGMPTEGVGMGRISNWLAGAGISYFIGLGLMIVGAIVARKADGAKNDAQNGDAALNGSPVDKAKILITAMSAELDKMPAVDETSFKSIERKLDDILEERIPEFLEIRAQVAAEMGLEAFAPMVGHFSAMERYAARSWSAISDGVLPEADASLTRAKHEAKQALSHF